MAIVTQVQAVVGVADASWLGWEGDDASAGKHRAEEPDALLCAPVDEELPAPVYFS